MDRPGCDESIETTVRKRRLLFAGFVARMGEKKIPKIALLEFEGGARYRGDKSLTG